MIADQPGHAVDAVKIALALLLGCTSPTSPPPDAVAVDIAPLADAPLDTPADAATCPGFDANPSGPCCESIERGCVLPSECAPPMGVSCEIYMCGPTPADWFKVCR